MSSVASPSLRGRAGWALAGALAAVVFLASAAEGQVETPASSGPISQRTVSLWRVPMASTPPTIDGKMAEGEWVDSSALSAFWYAIHGQYYFMAPFQTQLQVYACYDREKLYLAFRSPVYPRGSWLRARGRYPDVIEHPLYGVYRDDYCGVGLAPYHDTVKTSRMGGFYMWINPINTIGDSGTGSGRGWQSDANTAAGVTDEYWVQEIAIPHKSLRVAGYADKDAEGQDVMRLPPPDGTQWHFSFRRCTGEWGTGGFKNEFSDTASKMILDPQAVSCQVNELGPVMEDIIDVTVTLKNHSEQSQTVRVGFFVESAEGPVYSSYSDGSIKDGLVELVPGERRTLRLRKPLPGITVTGDLLWFDVRSAGEPAKPIFLTKLIYFHSQDKPKFREKRIERIAANRPPRKDFDYRFDYSYKNNTISAVVDTGIYGASDEAQTAVRAQVMVVSAAAGEPVATVSADFTGPFACLLKPLPKLTEGETYEASVLLFDKNNRIVGEDAVTFVKDTKEWMNNKVGLDDVVWEPFTPMEPLGEGGAEGFATLNHRFTLNPSGLPAQVVIKPDPRNLPLEWRGRVEQIDPAKLIRYGAGPQLRDGGYRIEAVVDGQRVAAEVIEPAKLVRRWQSELEYRSKLRVGPVRVDLTVQYDCDGAMHLTMAYGSKTSAKIDLLEMVADYAGVMDMTPGQGTEGIVWDSAEKDPELYYSKFINWKRFGSNERAFSWICRTEKGWMLDRHGSSMWLERNVAGELTWRVKFVNHTADIQGRREVAFTVLTSPAKPRPADWRTHAWYYRGDTYAALYMMTVPITEKWLDGYNELLTKHEPGFKPYKDWVDYMNRQAPFAVGNRGLSIKEALARPKEKITRPWVRYGLCRNVSVHDMIDGFYEERAVFWLARHIREGRKCGFWWDETWPDFSEANWSDRLATGDAYMRDPNDVKEKELPWHRGFLAHYMRRTQKRLARVWADANLPLRNFFWANDAATAYESFGWDMQLVEMAGSAHTSYEVDSVVNYPKDRFRFFCQKWTGLIPRLVPQYGGPRTHLRSGDDKRLDRQYLGRSLAHDIAACANGPHGWFLQFEQTIRLLNVLHEFGYFDEQTTEFVPYWHTEGDALRYGPDYGDRKFTVFTVPAAKNVYVSAFRRPYQKDGREGYQVLFVLFSEADEPVEANLHLLRPERFFGSGGRNSLPLSEALAEMTPEKEAHADLLAEWAKTADADRLVLYDPEFGRLVDRLSDAEARKLDNPTGESYGPVYLPAHNYRLLWGYYLPPAGEQARAAGKEAQ